MSRFFRHSKACSRFPIVDALLLLAVSLAGVQHVHADPLSTINLIRTQGCASETPAGSTVRINGELTDVARELAQTSRLNEALSRTGYPAGDSVGIYLRGSASDAAVRSIIENGYCTAVSNPELNEIGIHRSGDQIWIVLAERLELPDEDDAEAIAAQVLELVNAARANPRQCGDRQFEPAQPLTMSSLLTEVAMTHAQDMARQRKMDHAGSDGSQPAQRATRAGYRWRVVGENVAAGQQNAEEVVAGWLDSPGHCSNIMEPRFREMGLAFVVVSGNPATYWTQMFGNPR